MADTPRTTGFRGREEFLSVLNARAQEIFRRLVERYLETGEPVGSRQLSRLLDQSLSPASVRNVMADLEELGLIASPHTSAGRAPTQAGLRFFVDAMLETARMGEEERRRIAGAMEQSAGNVEDLLDEASAVLSGLSHGAGLVIAAKADPVLRHLEFVRLDAATGMAILVGEDGHVENRVFALPAGLTGSALTEASNYLNSFVVGKTVNEARLALADARRRQQIELDRLAGHLVEAGLATLSAAQNAPTLIVRGRANLLAATMASEELDRIRQLFDELESKQALIDLLGNTENAEGVRIFIGSENKLFSLSGSSVILSPYRDAAEKVVGVVGVIGPTRLNYARIVPVVDYTAQVISQIIARKA